MGNEEFLKLFEDIMTPKCSKCGAKLSSYPYYDDNCEIRICGKCGKINTKEKRWKIR